MEKYNDMRRLEEAVRGHRVGRVFDPSVVRMPCAS
jgi:hypothetical protein